MLQCVNRLNDIYIPSENVASSNFEPVSASGWSVKSIKVTSSTGAALTTSSIFTTVGGDDVTTLTAKDTLVAGKTEKVTVVYKCNTIEGLEQSVTYTATSTAEKVAYTK